MRCADGRRDARRRSPARGADLDRIAAAHRRRHAHGADPHRRHRAERAAHGAGQAQRPRARAGRSASPTRLGDAVVAPVLAYVPEGRIAPPAQHMRWAGTISHPRAPCSRPCSRAPRAACGSTACARWCCSVTTAATAPAWTASRRGSTANGPRAGLPRRMRCPSTIAPRPPTSRRSLRRRVIASAEIGSHAGLADTSLTLAIDPALVRADGRCACVGQGGRRRRRRRPAPRQRRTRPRRRRRTSSTPASSAIRAAFRSRGNGPPPDDLDVPRSTTPMTSRTHERIAGPAQGVRRNALGRRGRGRGSAAGCRRPPPARSRVRPALSPVPPPARRSMAAAAETRNVYAGSACRQGQPGGGRRRLAHLRAQPARRTTSM